jgi:hypothetical protein
MMNPEAIPELLPVDGFWLLVGFDISILSIYSEPSNWCEANRTFSQLLH